MTVAICRDAGDARLPCCYVSSCPEVRQRLQHYAPGGSIRGASCWAWAGQAERRDSEAALADGGRVLCFQCGRNYAREYFGRANEPHNGVVQNPFVCSRCWRDPVEPAA